MHLENITLGQMLQGLPVPPKPRARQDMGSHAVHWGSGCGMHPAHTKILQWTDLEGKSFEISAWQQQQFATSQAWSLSLLSSNLERSLLQGAKSFW